MKPKAKTVEEVYLRGDEPKTPQMQRYLDDKAKEYAKRMEAEEKPSR